jgi:hypothetical protein
MSGTEWQAGLTERCTQVVTAYADLYAHLDKLAYIKTDRTDLMRIASDQVEDMIVALDALS